MARWHYLDPPLLWLFPAAYAAHLAEETLAGEGLRFWIGRVGQAPLSLGGFIVLNAIGLALIVGGVAVTARRQSHGWVAIGLVTLFLLNAVLHVLGTIATRTYSPGLVTAVVLYVPLASLAGLRAASQASASDWQSGVLVGVGVQAAVSAVALSGLLR